MKNNIKDISRQISRMSSHDLIELEGALLNNGISATMYRFSPIVSIWDEDNADTCALYLRRSGDRKLLLVKTVKELFGWGLKEAKNVVDNYPCFLKTHIPREEAEKMAETLNETGAYVVIKENPNHED